MKSAGQDIHILPIDPIDQPFPVIDPPAPEAGQLSRQRLRLAKALIPVSADIFDQPIDLVQCFPVFDLPADIVAPAVIREYLIHSQPPRSDF